MGQADSLLDDEDVEEDLEKHKGGYLPLKIDYFIPDDIFFTVFTFLGLADIGRIKLCCKRFYYLSHLARNSFKFNGNSAGDPKAIKEIVEVLTKVDVCHRYRTIDLGWLHLEAADLNIVTEKCRNLRKLLLRKCVKIDDEAMCCIVKNCANLKELDIVGAQHISRKGMKTISTLKLEYFAVSSFKRTPMGIPEEMSDLVERYEGKDQPECCEGNNRNYFFYEFFAHGNEGKDLKRLYIDSKFDNIPQYHSRLYNIISCVEDHLFKYFPRGRENEKSYENLESLELYEYFNNNNDAEHLNVLFPNIRRFELCFAKNYNRVDMKFLEKSLHENKVKVLRIPSLNDEFYILNKFKELKSLRIEGPPGVKNTNTSFSFSNKLIQCAKTLRFLEVTTMSCSCPTPFSSSEKYHFLDIREFEGLEKLIFSFRRMTLTAFNVYIVPYLVSQGPKLRHLEIFLPQKYTVKDKLKNWDFSFIKSLENCSILGLKGIPNKKGAEMAVKKLLECKPVLRKKLRSLNFSGMREARKWMVKQILKGFHKSTLEELVMFGVGGVYGVELNLLRKKYSIRLYVTNR